VGRADFWVSAIESFRRLVPNSGAMTEQEANAWADTLVRDSAAGIFSVPAITTATSRGGHRRSLGTENQHIDVQITTLVVLAAYSSVLGHMIGPYLKSCANKVLHSG
jgi:hypothetical protein